MRKKRIAAAHRAEEIDKLLQEFDTCKLKVFKSSGNKGKKYACQHDLRKLWSEKERIPRLLEVGVPPSQLEQEICEATKSHLTTIISILFHVEAKECLKNFRRWFFHRRSATPKFWDSQLPLPSKDIIFLEEEDQKKRTDFENKQYKFIPFIINLDVSGVVQVGERLRLPFESSECIGEGSFGKVEKVAVSSRCISSRNGMMFWDEVWEIYPCLFHRD